MKINIAEIHELIESYQSFLNEWNNDSDYMEIKTSGSTGNPKTIQLSKKAMKASANKTIKYFELKENDTALLCLPLHTIAAKMMFVRAIEGKLNLDVHYPNASPIAKLNKRIGFIAMTPMQVLASMDYIDKFKYLQTILLGGAPIDSNLEKKLLSIKNCHFFHSYGMTETASHVAVRKISSDVDKIYHALDRISFKTDNRGCLVIDYPEISNKEIVTNDMVDLIDSYSFIWKGRFDFVINSGGIKIHVEELENSIKELIDLPFFIASIKDNTLGEKIVLYIESKSPVNTSLIHEKLSLNINKYKLPKEYFIIPNFTYNTGGKLNRIKSQMHASLK